MALCNTPNRAPCSLTPPLPSFSHQSRSISFTLSATPKRVSSSSRTGKFDSRNRKNIPTKEENGTFESIQIDPKDEETITNTTSVVDDGFIMPKLPGKEPDFWEGPQWDGLGFLVQYLWAFGFLFALMACGIAVVTYNEGATDFKETTVYKEAIQSRELLEEPDASNSDVFESNPTEQAPSLE